MDENFKRINLNDPNTFEMICVDDKIIYEDEDRKEEVRALVLKKDKASFKAAYRAKNCLGGNMINQDYYHLMPGQGIINFGPDRNYSENVVLEKANYFILDKKLKGAGI